MGHQGATALLAHRISVRHTIDIDLYRAGAIADVERQLRHAASLDIGDWMRFEVGPPVNVQAIGAQGARNKVQSFIIWTSQEPHVFRRAAPFFAPVNGAQVVCVSDQAVPEIALGVEALDLIQLDRRVFSGISGAPGDPPVRAGQTGRQISASSDLWTSVSAPRLCQDFAVGGFPHPDQASLLAEYDGVIPAPNHRVGAVGRGRDGHELTG